MNCIADLPWHHNPTWPKCNAMPCEPTHPCSIMPISTFFPVGAVSKPPITSPSIVSMIFYKKILFSPILNSCELWFYKSAPARGMYYTVTQCVRVVVLRWRPRWWGWMWFFCSVSVSAARLGFFSFHWGEICFFVFLEWMWYIYLHLQRADKSSLGFHSLKMR